MTLREDICHSTRTLHDSSVLLRNVIPMTRHPIGFAGEFELGCWEMSSGYLRVFFLGHVRMKKHCSQQYNRGCFYFFYPLLLFLLLWKKNSREWEFPNQCEVVVLKLSFRFDRRCYKTSNVQFLVKSVFLTQCPMHSFTSSFMCEGRVCAHMKSSLQTFRSRNPLLRKVSHFVLL